jgi:hypothetical protein
MIPVPDPEAFHGRSVPLAAPSAAETADGDETKRRHDRDQELSAWWASSFTLLVG